MTINYVTGDATQPIGDGNKIIVHICNDVGAWGAGFVVALSRRWRQPEQTYRNLFRDNTALKLGDVQLVNVEPDIWVANLIGQRSLAHRDGNPPIRYDAIRDGLTKLHKEAYQLEASIHMPRIGCGLAGGRWDIIKALIDDTLSGLQVTVYDLP